MRFIAFEFKVMELFDALVHKSVKLFSRRGLSLGYFMRQRSVVQVSVCVDGSEYGGVGVVGTETIKA